MTGRKKPILPPLVVGRHTHGDFCLNSYEIRCSAGDYQRGEHGYYVQQVKGRLIARFPFSQDTQELGRDIGGEQRANAQLLVAAPVMLSVLKTLRPSACGVAAIYIDAAVALAEAKP
jgi:hypothetical protein